MQITYLILVHKDPKHLSNLVHSLKSDNSQFVIHVDKTEELEHFKAYLHSSDLHHVHFVLERFMTFWGSFELVQATLSALKYIRKHLSSTKRIVLLSGQDYPIKNNIYIESYLLANPNTIFLDYWKVPLSKWINGGKFRFPHFERVNEALKIYAGSQWMSFPYDTINLIFDFLEENPDFITYFRAVMIPDESFFQTLLLNCEMPSVLHNIRKQNLHLIEWDFPYMHPRLLGETDFNSIKKSKYLFARKFASTESSELLARIDSDLLRLQNN